jgi:antitoxin component YwqK of YwqJK toxin-antitoxin module
MNIKLIIIPLLSLISAVAICQTATDLNKSDQLGRKQGHWIKKNPDNTILYDGFFKDDHPVGEFKRYDENNVLKSVLIFSEDGKSADASIYHPNGFIASKGKYINQIKEGRWQFFSSIVNGYMICVEIYKSNKRNGPSQKFYIGGKIAELTNYVNDLRQGEWTQYNVDGSVCLRSSYKNGMLDGKYELWGENGKLELSGQYKNDSREGTWLIYKSDGSLRYKVEYIDGITKDKQLDIDLSDYMDLLEKNKGKIADPEKTGVIRQ